MSADDTPCPCNSGFPFAACCAPFLTGLGPAPTAEALMRSRYTAYARGRKDYLLETWYPATRPGTLILDPRIRWLGLQVRGTWDGHPGDTEGRVEFVARCKRDGRATRIREVSRFVFEDGRWYYVDGDNQDARPPGR